MGIVKPGAKRYQRSVTSDVLRATTVRDFGGMWNVADNDLNLQSKYQTKLVNVERGSDGVPKVRYGNRPHADVSIGRLQECTLELVGGLNTATVQAPAHKLVKGSKVRFVGIEPGTYTGISANILEQFMIVDNTAANHFTILLPKWASGPSLDIECEFQTEGALGDIIDVEYFEGKLVYVTTLGYIGAIDADGSNQLLWTPTITYYQTMEEEVAAAVVSYTLGSNILRVNSGVATPPLVAGQIIQLSTYTAMPGIPPGQINGRHIIESVQGAQYLIRVANNATNTGTRTGLLEFSISQSWRATPFASHAIFNRELIFVNGLDKPVVVSFDFTQPVKFLIDPVSGTNINVPIGKYIAAGDDYVAISGNALEPGKVWFASTRTNNTWEGDPDPNDATSIDASKMVNTSTPEVTGLAFHKNVLFVSFENNFVALALGNITDEGLHLVTKQDVINQFGATAHKSLMSVGEHFYGCDFAGLTDISRTFINQDEFKPVRASELIAPHLATALGQLTVLESNEKIWALYDRRESRYWLFVPRPGSDKYYTYVYLYLPERKISGWCLFTGLDFECGCRSEYDRLFGCKGSKVFVLGNDNDPIFTDAGTPIPWIFETPWSDFDKRVLIKKLRYIQMDTAGDAVFTFKLFVDRIYDDLKFLDDHPDEEYDEFSYPLRPERTMDFIASGGGGYGRETQRYGGGRRTARAKMMALPAEFSLCKIRLEGSTDKMFKLIAVSMLYQVGSVRR